MKRARDNALRVLASVLALLGGFVYIGAGITGDVSPGARNADSAYTQAALQTLLGTGMILAAFIAFWKIERRRGWLLAAAMVLVVGLLLAVSRLNG
jgi:hypothetical protein